MGVPSSPFFNGAPNWGRTGLKLQPVEDATDIIKAWIEEFNSQHRPPNVKLLGDEDGNLSYPYGNLNRHPISIYTDEDCHRDLLFNLTQKAKGLTKEGLFFPREVEVVDLRASKVAFFYTLSELVGRDPLAGTGINLYVATTALTGLALVGLPTADKVARLAPRVNYVPMPLDKETNPDGTCYFLSYTGTYYTEKQ